MRADLKNKVKPRDVLEVHQKYRGMFGASVEVLYVTSALPYHDGTEKTPNTPWFDIVTTNGIPHRGLSHTHFTKRRRMK